MPRGLQHGKYAGPASWKRATRRGVICAVSMTGYMGVVWGICSGELVFAGVTVNGAVLFHRPFGIDPQSHLG